MIRIRSCSCFDVGNSKNIIHPCDLSSRVQTIVKYKETEKLFIVKVSIQGYLGDIKDFYKYLNLCYLYRKQNNLSIMGEGDSSFLQDYQRDSFVKLLIKEYLEYLESKLILSVSMFVLKFQNIVIYLNLTRYQYAHLYLQNFINYSEKTIILLPYWDNEILTNS